MPPSTVKKPSAFKRLSCRRCRFRKLKCTRTEPCSNCSSPGQKCEYSESDTKRSPVSRSYVSDLEEQIARLESLLVRLQATNDMAGVRAILANANIDDHVSKPQVQSGVRIKIERDLTVGSNTAPTDQNYRHSSHLHIESEAGSLLCHGPTSIFHFPIVPLPINHDTSKCCSISNLPGDHMDHNSHISLVAKHFGINMQERLVNCALEEFFKWQYPYFMFIYREAFLRDHFASQSDRHGEARDHNYWSAPLLFAVCALGLLVTSQHDASERFFAAAESLLLVTGIAQPCITTVQAFLCLAYYEIGRGNLSKGWGFSGIALRMAQDLGFQRDPYKWQLTDKSIAYTKEDMEVRRRIYWGCYISDKFISLIFGRPIFFYDDDAEVELMDRLPDDPSMTKWLPVGLNDEGSTGSSTRRSPLIPSFKAQIGLAKVIQHILTKLYAANQDPQGIRRKAYIDAMELELSRWESSLDDSLRWNKWQPPSTPLIPNVAALHVLFHSLRIILNLEKINMMGPSSAVLDGNKPRDICKSSAQNIISIVRKYRSQHGLQYSPLIFIYGAVRAAQAVASFGIPDEFSYLLQVLNECSGTWTLAQDLKEKLGSVLRDRFPIQKQSLHE